MATTPPVNDPVAGRPRVSVVVIVHRRTEFLAQALDSLWAQTLPSDAFEVVLVGNRIEPDVEQSVLRRGGRVIRSTNEDLGAKLVEGGKASRGEILAFLEDDDAFRREKLERVVALFDRSPDLVYLHNGFELVDPLGRPGPRGARRAKEMSRRRRAGPIELVSPVTVRKLRPLTGIAPDFNDSSISVRRSLVEAAPDLIHRAGTGCDELLFFLALTSGGRVRIDPEPLTFIRVHSASLSNPVGGDAVRQRAQRQRFSQSTAESLSLLDEVLGQRPSPALQLELDARHAVQGSIGLLRGVGPNRSEMLHNLVGQLVSRRAPTARTYRIVIALGLVYLISPRLAAWLYDRGKGWSP